MINSAVNPVVSRYKEKYIYIILCCTALSFLISLTMLQLFTAVLSILWLTEKYTEKKKSLNFISVVFAVFIIFRVISIFLSEFPGSSYQALYKDALFYLSFFAFSFYIQTISLKNKSGVFNSLVYSALIVSIIGIVLYNLGLKHRAASFVSGYMTYSAFLTGSFGFFILRKYTIISKYRNVITAIMGAVIISGVILAMSRVDILVASLMLIISIISRPGKVIYLSILIPVTAFIVLVSFNNNSSEAERRVANPGSLSDRNILWNTAYQYADNHIFWGYGPRTFDNIFADKGKLADKSIGSWHNDFITVYIESGIFALLLFLTLIAAIYVKSIKMLKFLNKRNRAFLWGGLLLISSLLISAFTSGFINNPILSIFFAFGYAFVNDRINNIRSTTT